MSNGQLEDAEINFNKALKIDPSFAPALQGLSKLSLHRGDLSSANQYSNQAVQADEEYREWSNKIMKITEQIQNGRRFVQQGQYDEAIEQYSAMLDNHPYFPEAAFYMGLTKIPTKRY